MEVAATTTTSRGPFQREVREWQHVDPNTGALLTGRLEADRWVNGPLNSYGKVETKVDCQTPHRAASVIPLCYTTLSK
ncbi:conserved hypothetical protein [Culex quinquefasciatus]|uniref:Uncharacterized protein n=1 Tax=Culex quinquefasciatus TaxID=7176 RepID=B0WCU5_CULQU|nr:conserved hypothetical protein [Culex quinquefasciatus]|eukprot:XP_001846529.1 conserved hypothetical protein [Culex quinquefasciatus]